MELLKRAMAIGELAETLRNVAHDTKREIDAFSDAEIVAEARYVLSLYSEGGTTSNDEINGEFGADARSEARRQVRMLRKLIKDRA